ncbi:MAG: hypothetical protein ACRDYU_15855 [Actinomycetes bacterium]
MPEQPPVTPTEASFATSTRAGMPVPEDVAAVLFTEPGPVHARPVGLVQRAVDRHLGGRMRPAVSRLWFRLSPSFREAMALWAEVVDVEMRLLSRRVARLEAETAVLGLVRADRAEAARFWELVRTAW